MLVTEGCSCCYSYELLIRKVFHMFRIGRGFASAGATLDDNGIVFLKVLEKEAV